MRQLFSLSLPVGLVLILSVLQFRLWVGDGSIAQQSVLDQKIAIQLAENAKLESRNAALYARVRDFKKGLDGVEERARHDLGMVAKDETFYMVIADH